MSYSYLIKIDKDLAEEKDEILKYIMDQINQDNMLEKINEIKCITSSDLTKICRDKISDIGKTMKQKQKSTDEYCNLCNDLFECKQFVFLFNVCKHKYHKKCINNFLKLNNATICPICKDDYLPNLINII
jgi:hypothetical protein